MKRKFQDELGCLHFEETKHSSSTMMGRRFVKHRTVKAERRASKYFVVAALIEHAEILKIEAIEAAEKAAKEAEAKRRTLPVFAELRAEDAFYAYKKHILSKELRDLNHLEHLNDVLSTLCYEGVEYDDIYKKVYRRLEKEWFG